MLLLWQQEWGFSDSVLTIAFACYAFSFLLALLVFGSLSDHLGRKPVIVGALALSLVSIGMLAVGPGVEWIITGRTLAGLTTGAVTAASTAAIVELATPGTRTGPIVAAAAPVGGLGLGSLFGGIAIELWGRDADLLLFGAIGVLLLIGIVVTVLAPETTTRVPGVLRSLVPQVVVPRAARTFFLQMLPILIAAWATGSLFLGLAPTIVHELLGIESGLINGVTASIHAFGVCVGNIAFGRLGVPVALRAGGIGLVVGVGLVVVGVVTGQLPLVVAGGVIEGLAFGTAFGAIFRGLAPLAPEHERAGTFAAVYVVAYLALGVPAVIAGQLIAPLGLMPTILGWTILIVALAAVGLLVQFASPPERARSA